MSRKATRAFGRSPAECARAAIVLAGLGMAAVWGLSRLVMRPESPLGAPLLGLGVPPVVIPLAGTLVVLALAGAGYGKALRSRPSFRVTDLGLEVADAMGTYRLAWGNIARVDEAAGGALGIQVRDREAVVATHAGSARQREWLRTLPPYGDWDFLYPQSDLGLPVQEVLGWIREHQAGGEETRG